MKIDKEREAFEAWEANGYNDPTHKEIARAGWYARAKLSTGCTHEWDFVEETGDGRALFRCDDCGAHKFVLGKWSAETRAALDGKKAEQCTGCGLPVDPKCGCPRGRQADLGEQKDWPSDEQLLEFAYPHSCRSGFVFTSSTLLKMFRLLLNKYAESSTETPVNESDESRLQDAKDAERYRWLKSQMRAMSVDMSGQHSWTLARSLPRAPSVDAACDAGIAIAQQGKEK